MSEPELAEVLAAIDARVLASSQPAAPEAPVREPQAEDRYVVFGLAALHCAASIRSIAEIEMLPPLTAVPHLPDWVRGVINLRGDIVSVVDLRTYLGMEGSAPEESWRILVARSLLGEITSCLIVDRVEGIVRLPDASIQPPRLAPDERIAPYVRGFCEEASRILVVLDLDKLLLSEDFRRFE